MKILIIDGDRRFSACLRGELAEVGWRVDVCGEGSRALKKLVSSKYDFILLELKLPDVSGYEVLRRIRENDLDTKIIIVSVLSYKTDIAKAFELGADDYLIKSFDTEELKARIGAISKRTAPMNLDLRFERGGYVFDHLNAVLRYGDRKISLSRLENKILFELFRANGFPSTYEYLLSQIWQESAKDGKGSRRFNKVQVIMCYLRRKVEKLRGKKPLFITAVDKGYKLL